MKNQFKYKTANGVPVSIDFRKLQQGKNGKAIKAPGISPIEAMVKIIAARKVRTFRSPIKFSIPKFFMVAGVPHTMRNGELCELVNTKNIALVSKPVKVRKSSVKKSK